MYHICKTWLKEVHGGWVWGVNFKKIKNKNTDCIQNRLCSLFYFMSKVSKVHNTESNNLMVCRYACNYMHVGGVESTLHVQYSF